MKINTRLIGRRLKFRKDFGPIPANSEGMIVSIIPKDDDVILQVASVGSLALVKSSEVNGGNIVLLPPIGDEEWLRNSQEIFEHFGAVYKPSDTLGDNNTRLAKAVEDDTGNGVTAHIIPPAIEVRAYVEELDREVGPFHIPLPCTAEKVDELIDRVSEMVDDEWEREEDEDNS